ncbi:MAG: TetR/AcrR family transcriptional regulator [Mycobacterium sp.]
MSAGPGELPSQAAGLSALFSDKILSAAAEEFITAGIKQTTIADVARLAGLPEEVVQQRWSAVEELVTAIVVRDLDSRRRQFTTAVQSRPTLDDKIVEGFTSVVWFLDSHPLVGGAVRSDAEMILPLAEVSISPVVGLGVAIISECIGTAVFEGSGMSVDSDALTEVLTRLVQSLLLTRGPSSPLTSRKHLHDYARQCVVPFVRAFTR